MLEETHFPEPVEGEEPMEKPDDWEAPDHSERLAEIDTQIAEIKATKSKEFAEFDKIETVFNKLTSDQAKRLEAEENARRQQELQEAQAAAQREALELIFKKKDLQAGIDDP